MDIAKTEGREVPNILPWELEEANNNGPVINDCFLGCTPHPLHRPRSVAFVGPEHDITSGGYYNHHHHSNTIVSTHPNFPPSFEQQQQHLHQHQQYTPTTLELHQPSADSIAENDQWLDEYMDLEQMTFSPAAVNTTTDTHISGYAGVDMTSASSYDNNSSADFFQSSESTTFCITGTETSSKHEVTMNSAMDSTYTSTTFIHTSPIDLVSQVPAAFGINNAYVPVPESEYSASYSPPNSAYSSDWSNSSDHSSSAAALSQDEILEQIHRECAELERKSASPKTTTPVDNCHTTLKRRTTMQRINAHNDPLSCTSSTSSLADGGQNSERKKELNRVAATKYREKKRRERELLSVEQKELVVRNRSLKGVAKELKSELVYLRKLINDMHARSGQQ